MTQQQFLAAPMNQRIDSLDIIRGFTVMLILLMNIQYFNFPMAAVSGYPGNFGDFTGINYISWLVIHIFVNQKGMLIFCALFGASSIIITNKLIEKKESPFNYYKRLAALFFIGAIHAYLIWWGDILLPYAVAGSFVFFMRNLSAKIQILIGVALYCILPSIFLYTGLSIESLTVAEIAQMENFWNITPEAAQYYVSVNTGPYLEQTAFRYQLATMMQFALLYNVWQIAGTMLMGIALFKMNILSASKSLSFYLKNGSAFLVVGCVLSGTGVYLNETNDWNYQFTQFFGYQFHSYGSLIMSWAYICLLLAVVKSNSFRMLKNIFAHIGRMSLTSYLMQSVFCAFIFYGWGLGYYGSVERWQLVLIVACIWIVQVQFAMFWFKRLNIGPIEYLIKKLINFKFKSRTVTKNPSEKGRPIC